MSYNRYGTRISGNYNRPRQFVPAGELNMGRQQSNYNNYSRLPQQVSNIQFHKPLSQSFTPAPPEPAPVTKAPLSQSFKPAPPEPAPVTKAPAQVDLETKSEAVDTSNVDDSSSRPPWMKSKLQGVKKVSNKERRRRQNENLRRLLTPKNALMVLNEIMPGEQVASQFKVEAVTGGAPLWRAGALCYRAALSLRGRRYEGHGENKLSARNAAAEQAIRDLMLRRMTRLLAEARAGTGANTSDSPATGTDASASDEHQEGDGDAESLPMIQLASYALHKLFAEWEYEGHKVPNLRPTSTSVSESSPEGAAEGPAGAPVGGPARRRELPASAATMHPCMLLTHMRSQLEYRELTPEGNCQQNLVFGMAIEVDGNTFVGKAQNKKEARKLAAKAACEALFNVKFENIIN